MSENLLSYFTVTFNQTFMRKYRPQDKPISNSLISNGITFEILVKLRPLINYNENCTIPSKLMCCSHTVKWWNNFTLKSRIIWLFSAKYCNPETVHYINSCATTDMAVLLRACFSFLWRPICMPCLYIIIPGAYTLRRHLNEAGMISRLKFLETSQTWFLDKCARHCLLKTGRSEQNSLPKHTGFSVTYG